MSRVLARRAKWIVWTLVLLCYVVPYGLLGGVAHWYGSFLFWAIAGAAVIVANLLMTADFDD